ncbi:MAG: alpha/beta hydrolase [Methylobacteriaceae bacterium]|nr:alpha/beta hydrolase [Methylobacteriaceae bacterium]
MDLTLVKDARRLGDASATLTATPQNPIPLGAIVRRVRTADGLALRAARWGAPSKPARGTVANFPGHAEFIEKYFEVVGELLARGFAVAVLDWRGQGGSARELANPRKGHVDDFSHYLRDVAAFAAEVIEPYCPKPWFGLGHSMGATILLTGAHDRVLPFERLLLVAPMLKIALVRRPRAARLLGQTLDVLGLGGAFVPGGSAIPAHTRPFPGNPLTSDPVRYARTATVTAAAPHLAIGSPTVSWINAAFRLRARLSDPDYPRRILMPTLIVACGADTIVDTPTIERFAASLKAGSHIVVPHAKHELLMERNVFREQFWAAFDAFIPGSTSQFTLGKAAR